MLVFMALYLEPGIVVGICQLFVAKLSSKWLALSIILCPTVLLLYLAQHLRSEEALNVGPNYRHEWAGFETTLVYSAFFVTLPFALAACRLTFKKHNRRKYD